MARQTISGVSGVLGDLISEPLAIQNGKRDLQTTDPDAVQSEIPTSRRQAKSRPRARLGRPPGRSPQVKLPKEKITVRIDARLADQYRDWSWRQRCQLGELVERALKDFYSRR